MTETGVAFVERVLPGVFDTASLRVNFVSHNAFINEFRGGVDFLFRGGGDFLELINKYTV